MTPFRRTSVAMALLVGFVVAIVLAARAYGESSRAARAAPAVAHPSARGAARDYWVGEFRRRWAVERRDGRARARTIRRLRATLRVASARVDVIGGVWVALARCESGGDWSYNGGSGFDGGLQFHPGTWAAYRRPGEPERAYEAPAWVQVRVAQRVLAVQGWGAWPACSRRLGLR